jgi:glycosyltransferase involved in cell wall biosynthesis
MRILFIHNKYRQAGGEDTALALETALLNKKGHAVETLIFDNEEIGQGTIAKIQALKNALYNRSSEKKLILKIREFGPDIIHVHNLFFVASPSILSGAAKMHIPVVLTVHNYRLICCNAILLRDNQPCEICVKRKLPLAGVRYRCYRDSAAASGMVTLVTGIHKFRHTWQTKVGKYIVLTKFAKDKLFESSLGIPLEQLVVKPNFVADQGVGSLPREGFFLFAGRLSREKGLYTLLEAFRDMPGQTLIIAGEGPEKNLLEVEYQGSENIRFLGQLDRVELSVLMKKCRALVFPSLWYEGLPYVILEAFCAGTPVIASNLGAMSDLIKDGYNGMHFKPGNALDLKEAVRRFGENRNDLYANARQTYLDHYHPEIHYISVMEIYDTTIKIHQAKAG